MLCVKEKLLNSPILYSLLSGALFAIRHRVDAQEKIIACWPLWRSHLSRTVGIQAITDAGAEVCSPVDSSGKVKVHFIYQDFSSYRTQQWANSGSWNCPLATRLGLFVSSSAQATHSLFGTMLLVALCVLLVKKVDHPVAMHCIPFPLVAICIWITPSKKHTSLHKHIPPTAGLLSRHLLVISKSSRFAFPPCIAGISINIPVVVEEIDAQD